MITNTELVDLVIRGGLIVNASHRERASLVINGGKVVALLDPASDTPPAIRTMDLSGQVILPGGVDPHCHIGETVGEFTQDSYESATIAALHGGTTTLVHFAIPENGESPLSAARRKLAAAAADSRIDTALHGGIITWTSDTHDEVRELAKMGLRTIKMFTTYKGERMAEPETVLEVLRILRQEGGMGYVHAEADHIIQDATALAETSGELLPEQMPSMRPEHAEAAAVAQVLATADHLRAPVYFVHQSTPKAVTKVRDARSHGVRAYSETCPHYLALNSESYKHDHAEAFVCCPPLRDELTRRELIECALRGEIDTVGSDHCCFTLKQKAVHSNDVRLMPNGMPGVETRIPATYTVLVQQSGMSLERFVALTSTNAARLNGLANKGTITVGADADLYSIDPTKSEITTVGNLHMDSDYTPYEGTRLYGWPQVVVAAGRVVLDEGGFHDPGAVGRHLETEPLADSLLT